MAVTNSTFTGNQATGTRPNNGSVGLGGAITNSGASSFTLTNVTIAGNHADWVGGGIVGGTAGTTLKNSIVANNTAANGGNPWNIAEELLEPPSATAVATSSGRRSTRATRTTSPAPWASPSPIPRLAALAANGGLTQTMALLAGSPALNSGVACPPPATDQRGVTRPQGAACDCRSLREPARRPISRSRRPTTARRRLPGQAITYTLVARNIGPTAVTGATVTDTFPATLTGVTWTCAASAGSSCAASGSGSISQMVNLLAAGTATYHRERHGGAASATRLVANTATVTAPTSGRGREPGQQLGHRRDPARAARWPSTP